METIEITGYLVEEKIEIAQKHLLPRQLENHGVKDKQLTIGNVVMEKIIEKYTRESGVRELDKRLAKIVRVTAKNIASGQNIIPSSSKILERYLGRRNIIVTFIPVTIRLVL